MPKIRACPHSGNGFGFLETPPRDSPEGLMEHIRQPPQAQSRGGAAWEKSEVVPVTGLEPVRCNAAWDFKSQASANSATPAFFSAGNRTIIGVFSPVVKHKTCGSQGRFWDCKTPPNRI